MPYNDPDITDPMTMHGVVIETQDDSAMCDMADCFVEEYVRSGFDAERIMHIFKTPGYAGSFLAYEALGEDAIRTLIDRHMSVRNHRQAAIATDRGAGRSISLPVLNS